MHRSKSSQEQVPQLWTRVKHTRKIILNKKKIINENN